MLLHLYTLLSYLATPFLPLLVLKRWWHGKEIPGRWLERFGISHTKRPRGKLVWLHAASVGEVNSIVPVINELHKVRPDWHFLITTITVTGNQAALKGLDKTAIIQFLPMDAPPYIALFLRRWQPDLALFVDSEIWPNLLRSIKKHSITLILLNARMSTKSFNKWSNYPKTAATLVQLFDLIFPSTKIDHERFANLGARNITYIGHLKYSTPPLTYNEENLQQLKAQIGLRPVFLCSSIHHGEISVCLSIHSSLRQKYPQLLTIIAPRHPEDGKAIIAAAIKQGINSTQRSKNGKINDKAEIYVADTIGELGLWYRLTPMAFIGGSLIDHGGQNMLEPARLACVPIVGPHIHNFTAIMEEMTTHHTVITCADAAAVAQAAIHLMQDAAALQSYKDNCLKFSASRENILTETINTLLKYVDENTEK
ncbi:MAG: 3-deoxy-D-manno-octulosonic acid transferase [Proteobacteria bacterium]|nr:3-deoxy-D-manno-octulosonic acid transferase [Pseudomonadota bacterium]